MKRQTVLFTGTVLDFKGFDDMHKLSDAISEINYHGQIDEIDFYIEGADIIAEIEVNKCELNNLTSFFYCLGDAYYEFKN